MTFLDFWRFCPTYLQTFLITWMNVCQWEQKRHLQTPESEQDLSLLSHVGDMLSIDMWCFRADQRGIIRHLSGESDTCSCSWGPNNWLTSDVIFGPEYQILSFTFVPESFETRDKYFLLFFFSLQNETFSWNVCLV